MITNLQGAGSILQELQALRTEASGVQLNATTVNSVPQSDFGTMLQQALDGVNSTMAKSDELKTRFDLGDESVSLSDVMIASQKSSLAFEATVQIRNKCVEAYKQIMQMQI
ncbi:MAG: flagellar hook-basal body complex protein FliE [Succinivibrionaceae bacterium]